jgi:8-oxo-dGTP pyrophosphatase MutT (NUDIX family)
MLIVHQTGAWHPGDVSIEWVESSRRIVPRVEEMIELAWRGAKARLGDKLFDGPMCRMESCSASDEGKLLLRLSRTSYRIFLGTNMTHPNLAEEYGPAILANPIGVSPALISSDGFLLLGRRNDSVAYYPHRLHPFAGALEPREKLDIFDEVRRELREELGFGPQDVSEIVCTGIIEDPVLRHPELVFAVRSTKSREQIQSQVKDEEHHASWSTPATAESIARALASEQEFTPVARGAILLWGRIEFGDEWFERVKSVSP